MDKKIEELHVPNRGLYVIRKTEDNMYTCRIISGVHGAFRAEIVTLDEARQFARETMDAWRQESKFVRIPRRELRNQTT